jgi:VWFA-related protein
MEEALTKIDSRGGTAMRDAISMSIDYLKEKGKKDKKILLVVTDGDDNTSSAANTIEKLLAKAQQSEVLMYCIGLLSEEERGRARRAKRAMEALAETSGGLAYFPEQAGEVEPLAVQVAHEIRNQYILGYTPHIEFDGSFRRIQVTAKGPNRPTVRTRPGYYATPDEKPPQGVPVALQSALKTPQ